MIVKSPTANKVETRTAKTLNIEKIIEINIRKMNNPIAKNTDLIILIIIFLYIFLQVIKKVTVHNKRKQDCECYCKQTNSTKLRY